MKAIICPQCGGLIKNISASGTTADCEYCGAKVFTGEAPRFGLFEEAKKRPLFENLTIAPRQRNPAGVFFWSITGTILLIGGLMAVSALLSVEPAHPHYPVQSTPAPLNISFPTTPLLPPKEDDDLLRFGGKGTSAGLFDGARQIAVDRHGHIYVADETLRVQRFDEQGKFLNLWNVKGEKNETIDKLAVANDGNSVYVLIGGEIVIYKGDTGQQQRVLTDSRKHYIDDFILRDDGSLMYVSEDGSNHEEFVRTKDRQIIDRFVNIHSLTAGAHLLTPGIKLAVSGSGDIFSVYAIASLTGTFEYSDEDLMTFHFSPNGRFVNKFAAGLMPNAILIDNQSRIYILAQNEIAVYAATGSELRRLKITGFANAFALDNQNNLYLLSGEMVRKLKPLWSEPSV